MAMDDYTRRLSKRLSSSEMVLYSCIAVILFATLIAKLWFVLFDPFADIKSGFSFAALVTAVAMEAVVLTSLFRANRRRKWLLSVSLFSFFAVVSASRFLGGEEGCGCFGALELSPLYSLALNVVILILLIRDRAALLAPSPPSDSFLSAEWIGGTIGVLLPIALALALTSTIQISGRDRVFAIIEDLSYDAPGEVYIARVKLVNKHNEPVRVIGYKKSCSCLLIDERQRIIDPNSSSVIALKIPKKSSSSWRHRLIFYLDCESQSFVTVDVSDEDAA